MNDSPEERTLVLTTEQSQLLRQMQGLAVDAQQRLQLAASMILAQYQLTGPWEMIGLDDGDAPVLRVRARL